MRARRLSSAVLVLGLLAVALVPAQAPPPAGPISVLSREGRRPLPTLDVQGRQMVGLDDLAALFQLQVREDAAARAVTVSYRNQTIVLTPEQPVVSAAGRLISLPAPLTRQGRRWLVPVEFISRALASIYDQKLDLRVDSRLLVLGDVRVPRVAAQYDESPGVLRVTLDVTPRTAAVVAQQPGRLVVRLEADSLDASLPQPPQSGLLNGIRVADAQTLHLELGPRFASYRTTSLGGAGSTAPLTIELLAPADAAAAPPSAPPASAPPAAAPAPAGPLPVFGESRPTIRTVVLDPGHGGEDAGAKGGGGALEKQVTLAIARQLRGVIEARLGLRVILTREDDRQLNADARVAIANNNKADLLISLHANGSPRAATRGATVFTLGLDRFGEDARRQSQADREVLPVFGGGSREFALVEWELAQAAHIEDSHALAGIVEQRFAASPAVPLVQVLRAPMRNLAGANMPAVLIDLGYLTNPDEEKLLGSNAFQSGIAQALTEAVIAFRDYLERRPPLP